MTVSRPAAALAAAFVGALAIAGCSQEQPAAPANTPAEAPQAPNRGMALLAHADRLEAMISAQAGSGALTPEAADRARQDLSQVKTRLVALQVQTTGPIPQADREAILQQLQAIEARLQPSPAP